MKLYVKNMVCSRCKMVVKTELEKLGFNPVSVELGEVELSEDLNDSDKIRINDALVVFWFTLIDNRKSQLIEKMKNLVVDLVHNKNNLIKINLSAYLSEHLQLSYKYVSNLFAAVEGTTVEQYFIAQKIERVKELLVYGELTLSEIAFELNYSTVAHLSGQFKKITGLSPSHFKQLKEKKRLPLEEV